MKGRSINDFSKLRETWIRSLALCFIALLGLPIFFDLLATVLLQKQVFRLPDGDIVHCIPIRNLLQRFPTPLTTWQTIPAMVPSDRSFPTVSPAVPQPGTSRQAKQLMAVATRRCPIGTVTTRRCPIGAVPKRFRPGVTHFIRTLGSKAFPRMKTVVPLLIINNQAQNSTQSDRASHPTLRLDGHEAHKYALTGVAGPYTGTQGHLSIWQPHVQDHDFSLAQVWVSSMDTNGKLHSLEAGWQVYKDLYSDSRSRLFVYWTADRYITTGCYNLDCPGFVQVSNKWLLGGSFEDVSTFESEFQYEMKIQIFKEERTGHWWLQLNDDNVGYWPRSLFGPGAFNDSNTRIQWGGEIWHRGGDYTDTQMGNGNRPSSSKTLRVAYVRNLGVVSCLQSLHDPPSSLSSIATYRECCDIIVHARRDDGSHASTWGTYAYFGGPGFNSDCIRVEPFH